MSDALRDAAQRIVAALEEIEVHLPSAISDDWTVDAHTTCLTLRDLRALRTALERECAPDASRDRVELMAARAGDLSASWCSVHDKPRARFECKSCFEELAAIALERPRPALPEPGAPTGDAVLDLLESAAKALRDVTVFTKGGGALMRELLADCDRIAKKCELAVWSAVAARREGDLEVGAGGAALPAEHAPPDLIAAAQAVVEADDDWDLNQNHTSTDWDAAIERLRAALGGSRPALAGSPALSAATIHEIIRRIQDALPHGEHSQIAPLYPTWEAAARIFDALRLYFEPPYAGAGRVSGTQEGTPLPPQTGNPPPVKHPDDAGNDADRVFRTLLDNGEPEPQ